MAGQPRSRARKAAITGRDASKTHVNVVKASQDKRNPPDRGISDRQRAEALIDEHGGIDHVLGEIECGNDLQAIAKAIGVSRTVLNRYLTLRDPGLDRINLARLSSADAFADKAVQVLSDLSSTSSMAAVQRARELASQYRWMASKLNPKRFGDKVQVDQNISGRIEHVPAAQVVSDVLGLLKQIAPASEPQPIEIEAQPVADDGG